MPFQPGNPSVAVRDRTEEQAKYEKLWGRHPEYRAVAPGEHVVPHFLNVVGPEPGSTIIDFGCGTGRASLALANRGYKVEMLDFAGNCLDPAVRAALGDRLHFTQHDLNRPSPVTATHALCTDVMEHIPPEEVDGVLLHILRAAEHVFFQISCEDDVCGRLIGAPLHLSVHPCDWWVEKFRSFNMEPTWHLDGGSYCLIYVRTGGDAKEIIDKGRLNAETEEILANVRANLAGDWREAVPHAKQEREIILLAGGPSLNDHIDTIRELRAGGAALITTNGTYNWCLERGLTPSAQIIVDSRQFNARFVQPVVDDCGYLIASQCHPDVFAQLPRERTWMWHTAMPEIVELLEERGTPWISPRGGSCVTLRAIPLLRMLGFYRFHIFGWDSCLRGDVHHAYSQPENDAAIVIPVTCGDQVFHCHPAHMSQAAEFIDMVRMMGDEISLEIYGDGLIAHILKTGAELASVN